MENCEVQGFWGLGLCDENLKFVVGFLSVSILTYGFWNHVYWYF